MSQSSDNVYAWDPSASRVGSNISSLDVDVKIGGGLDTQNLEEPIKILLPSSGKNILLLDTHKD